MATTRAAIHLFIAPQPPIPRSFADALRQGWRIDIKRSQVVMEEGEFLRGHAHGTLTLTKKGHRSISVPYVGDLHFGAPKVLR